MKKRAVLLFLLSVSLSAACEQAASSADYEFLVRHQPAAHRGVVSEDYLRENVALAQEARAAAPWKDQLTDELYREHILPYTVIDEEVDRWRAKFRALFWPRVKDCRTIREAAAILATNVWPAVDVRYDVRRDKANQSPLHSMRIHMASCTGLAILQIDAFRACGIPARLTGCNWTPIPGNHSWLEYWDGGSWHFFGDPDGDNPSPVDSCWFTDYAARADASHPRTRIYATRWSPNPQGVRFWSTWDGTDRPSAVNADDVTETYRRFYKPSQAARIGFVARGPDGRRQPVAFRVVLSGSFKVVYEGKTYDESHDMNDHVLVEQPSGTKVFVQAKNADGTWQEPELLEFADRQKVHVLSAR